MDGIHDLGGKEGFGAIEKESDPRPFPTRWEGAVFTMIRTLYGAGVTHNTDQFRHAIERIDPISYLHDGYYGRWLGAAETLLVEAGVLEQEEITARAVSMGAASGDRIAARPRAVPDAFADDYPSAGATAERSVTSAPRFSTGDRVRTAEVGHSGHTRLPAYVRGKAGTIIAHHGGWVYPDTNAHGRGEAPQHLYTVQFEAAVLWGDEAAGGDVVCIDLFEPYLEEASS